MNDLKIDVFQGVGYDCNILLLNGEVLIDSGTGHNFNVFLHWLKEHTDPLDVHTLILTHRHYDHTGGASDVMDETGATAFIHELDAPPLQTGDAVTTGARTFQGGQEPIDVVPISENHQFTIDGHIFDVLYTPGHSIGSISLFNKEKGILISGDTIFANGGVGRWDLATGDHGALKESISRLSKLEIRDLYPGHDVHIIGNGKEHAMMALESIQETPFDLMMRRLRLFSKD